MRLCPLQDWQEVADKHRLFLMEKIYIV